MSEKSDSAALAKAFAAIIISNLIGALFGGGVLWFGCWLFGASLPYWAACIIAYGALVLYGVISGISSQKPNRVISQVDEQRLAQVNAENPDEFVVYAADEVAENIIRGIERGEIPSSVAFVETWGSEEIQQVLRNAKEAVPNASDAAVGRHFALLTVKLREKAMARGFKLQPPA